MLLQWLYNLFSQISAGALPQLAYNLFKFIDGFLVICQLEKEPMKGFANVQEIFSKTISLVIDLVKVSRTSTVYTFSDR